MSEKEADKPFVQAVVWADTYKRLVAENQELREKLEERKQQVKELANRVDELEKRWNKVRNDFFLAGIKLDFEIKNKIAP